MKHCKKCDTSKPDSDFNRDKSKADGRCATCRECSRQRSAEWRVSNPERNAQIKRDWYKRNAKSILERYRAEYAKNPENKRRSNRESNLRNADRIRERDRIRYMLNPEPTKLRAKQWRAENRELHRAQSRACTSRRQVRKRQLPTFEVADRDLRRLLASPCAVLGCLNRDIEIDHVIPIARGGSHGIGNLQALCRSHNASKGARLWIEFRVYLRRREQVAA